MVQYSPHPSSRPTPHISFASHLCVLPTTDLPSIPTQTNDPEVFAGKDPSRALATSSLKAEECVPEWTDLEDKHKTVLDEWYTFFSKRYNVVGKISLAGDAPGMQEPKM